MAKFEEHAAKLDVKSIVVTMILSALGFLTALAWRDAIRDTIDLFVPTGEGLTFTYFAAILVTIIAVVVTFVLVKLQKANLIPDHLEKKIKGKLRKKKKQ